MRKMSLSVIVIAGLAAGPVALSTPVLAEDGCAASVCSGGGSACSDLSFLSALDTICSLSPGGACLSRCGCCLDETTDVFAGVTFAAPSTATPVWPGLGGRGELAAKSELCLLRDLPKAPGGEVVNDPSVSVGFLGEAKVKQRVALVSFDPVAGTMEGFQSVDVCVPAFGCIDNQVQKFKATLLSAPAASDLHCGDYPFDDSYALQISTTDTEHRLDVELPNIQVITPFGEVSAAPEFHYETALKSGFPTDQNNDRESDFCYTYGSTLSWNVGTSDGASGLNFLCALLPPPSQQPGYGEIGQIALGGRSSKTVYTPGSAVPRPDLDLSIARTGDEQKPVGSVEASLPVTYGIPELPLPDNFKHDPFNLDASLVVTPTINNRFASQFQIYGSDADYERVTPIVPDCHDHPFKRAHVVLESRAEADVLFTITAGFNLVLQVHHDFGGFIGDITMTVLEKHKNVPVLSVTPPPQFEESPPNGARATFENLPDPTFTSLTSFNGPVADPDTWLNDCFQSPPPAGQTPPTATFTPDDPTKLSLVLEFPCNVCLGWGGLAQACGPKRNGASCTPDFQQCFPADYHCVFTDGVCTDPQGNDGCTLYDVPLDLLGDAADAVNVLYPASQDLSGKQWLCDSPGKTGCMDLCTYDPKRSQPLQVVQSAVDLEPDRCGATGTGTFCTRNAGCDDGNPCTLDQCVGPSEFGNCKHAPQDGTCDDGLSCNGADQCALGACALHEGNPCASGCCEESTDSCVPSCPSTLPRCGNGLLQPGEQCDDGNTADGDGCSSACRLETPPPDCTTAFAVTSELWPPNHSFVKVTVAGVPDSLGDPATVTITGITQDEPLNSVGDGDTCPDAAGIGTPTARLRAERAGTPGAPGDGRVYHIGFTAVDGHGGQCTGTVSVCVPHDQRPGHVCVDEGPLVDSTGPCDAGGKPPSVSGD